MDHIVRIDGHSDNKAPIVLHLLPGEETIFNLVVINDGEPLDVSLRASDPVFKAVRFRRSDDHVDGKQIIPIFARMPSDTDRLEGEIILKSNSGESRVPIIILPDLTLPDKPGRSGSSLPSSHLGRSPSKARIREVAPLEEARTEDYRKDKNPDADEDDMDIIDPDGKDDGEEDEDRDPNDPSEDQDVEFVPPLEGQSGEDEKDGRRISFSKDIDLERYRSARLLRRVEDLSEMGGNNHNKERIGPVRGNGESRGADDYFAAADFPDRDRIDRSISQSDPFESPREERSMQIDESDQDTESFIGPGSGGRGAFSSIGEDEGSMQRFDSDQISPERTEEGIDEEDDIRAIGAMHIVPAIIFLGLVSALVLTFITESIPEFPGALVSSILIVTLIIYGAATLLKA